MDYYWRGDKVINKFQNAIDLEYLLIATAYFSEYGLKLLKTVIDRNQLKRENVKLYLSPNFSYQKPGDLLESLHKIATVFIVDSIPFHAKVYWFHAKEKQYVIFGSSNFTAGGIEKNLEFDAIHDLDSEEDRFKFQIFFEFCESKSKTVDDSRISIYQQHDEIYQDLLANERKLKRKLLQSLHQDDPFMEEEYDIEDYYFNFEDYEVFFPRNFKQNDTYINERRDRVKEKMLNIHKHIYNKHIKLFNLYCHKDEAYICSSARPNSYNKEQVTWLGIRYGKSPKQVNYINATQNVKNTYGEDYGFQKHACLQFSITRHGFEINLFHAVEHKAHDRSYLHGELDKNPHFKDKLNREIANLKGEGFEWIIFDNQLDKEFIYVIDEEPEENFSSFYTAYDLDGRESFLSCLYKWDDKGIQDMDVITQQIVTKMQKLLPLYKLIAFRV
ncbi:phospholipase D family protein [Paenibacillus sp. FSL R7-0312]|uniref:phospholipase D family protein n=2 Tax=unclassified Paenibacillus TaxID=185978 RepID=UPI0030FC5E84